jgi:lysophospholipase
LSNTDGGSGAGFEPDSLRARLPVFDVSEHLPDSTNIPEDYRGYLDHYDLNACVELASVYRYGTVEACGYSIAVQQFDCAEARGIVTVLHGYFDHVGLYGHVVELLLRSGFCVLAFDLPGHGLSSGDRAGVRTFDEYAAVLDQIIALLPAASATQPRLAVGQSTGCAILLQHLLAHGAGTPFDACVLMAPLVRPQSWLQAKILFRMLGAFREYWPRKWNHNTHNDQFQDFIRHHDPLQPHLINASWVKALVNWVPMIEAHEPLPTAEDRGAKLPQVTILQGDEDATVDWEYNLPVLARLLPGSRQQVLKGVRHHMVNESAEYRELVFERLLEALNEAAVRG